MAKNIKYMTNKSEFLTEQVSDYKTINANCYVDIEELIEMSVEMHEMRVRIYKKRVEIYGIRVGEC